MRVHSTDRIVIVGAGLGAVYAALTLAPRPVLMITAGTLGGEASSVWAQGGVAAALDSLDSPAAHCADTIRAGAGLVDPEIAALVTLDAPDRVHDLTALGAPFDRDSDGAYLLSREAAHSAARVARVKGDRSGAEIMSALITRLRELSSVQVLENTRVVGLTTDAGRVTGVALQANAGSRTETVLAPGVLLAAGGSGGLFALTSNPPGINGQGLGMAARAGARIRDAEFVQFHPTAMDVGADPAPLLTEALRGEGATLITAAGERFMPKVHAAAELAPRDVVARAVFAQTQSGARPALDARAALGGRGAAHFPTVTAACLRHGIDPARHPIPVAAAAHYHMGGVATDARGRASLPGLWACGEVAATGLHGANRLASNGLLEALVLARAAAQDMAAQLPVGSDKPLELSFTPAEKQTDLSVLTALRTTMSADVGVIRSGAGLRRALRAIERLSADQSDPILANVTAAATLIAAAALSREETRGAHVRTDFPETASTAHHSDLTLDDALAIRARAAKEPA